VLACGYASGVESAEPLLVEMYKMGKGSFQVCLDPLVAGAIQREAPIICPLEIGTTMTNFSQMIEHMKSRMNSAVQARLSVKAGVKFPCLTRLCAIIPKP
jgi:hypothetical protein